MAALAQQTAQLHVTWDAPEPLRTQLRTLLPAPALETGERRRAAIRPWVRDVRRRVPEIGRAHV